MNADVYNEIFENKLGLDVMGLEHLYPELILRIKETTFPTFSSFIPCIYPYLFDTRDKNVTIGREFMSNIIQIRIVDDAIKQMNLSILGCKNIKPVTIKENAYDNKFSSRTSALLMASNYNVYDILVGSSMQATNSEVRQMLGAATTVQLKGSDILEIKNPYTGQLQVAELLISHPTINSIPDSFREEFIRLATYDVQIYLHSTLKYMEDVVTPAGNINLRIGEYENATREREDYLKEFRSRSFADRVINNYFTVI
jgi:hypothetical protein